MKKYIYIIIVVLMILPAFADSQGGYAGAYLNMGVNASSVSMGRTGVAIPTKGAPMYNNPAGLAFIKNKMAEFDYFFLNLDRNLHYTGLSTSVPPTAGVGFAWIHAGVDNIQGRSGTGRRTATYQTGENAFILSFANSFFQGFSLGLSIKMVRYNMLDLVGDGVGVDLGLLYQVTDDITLGAQIRDIASGYNWDTSDIFGDTEGQSYKEQFPLKGLVGLAWQHKNFIITGDLEYSDSEIFKYHAGMEYSYQKIAALRAGLNNNSPTFGAGLKYNVFKNIDTELNYCLIFDSVGDGNTHLFSWKFLF